MWNCTQNTNANCILLMSLTTRSTEELSDDQFEETPITLPSRKHQTSLCFKLGDNSDLQLGIALSCSLDSSKGRGSRQRSVKPCLILTGEEMKSEIEQRASNFIIQSFAPENTAGQKKLQLLPSYYSGCSKNALCSCFECGCAHCKELR